jgi:hypothetical protein
MEDSLFGGPGTSARSELAPYQKAGAPQTFWSDARDFITKKRAP